MLVGTPAMWPASRQRAAVHAALSLFGALLVLVLVSGCGDGVASLPEEVERPVTVEVVALEPQLLRNMVEIPGQLEAEYSITVRPEIEGVIARIEFVEGHEASEGDILFRLRDHEQAARLREAKAQLALAEEVHRRTAELARRDVSSVAQLDRAAAEREVARARVEIARVELQRTRIKAPFKGVLGARLVSLGDRVLEETQLVELDAIERLQLVFTLPEVAVGIVLPGAPVRIRVAPFPGEIFEGEVFFVSPTLDPATRRILLKAWIPNADRRLRPGLFATIEAEIERRENALLVPETAVVYDLDGIYVWRLGEGDVAERVPVEIGLHSEGRVEVRGGLRSGDVVVVAGTHKLLPGKAVRRAQPPTTQAAETPEEGRGS